MICSRCSLIHSDWLSCEQAQALNEFREPTEEALETLPANQLVPTEEVVEFLVDNWPKPKKRGWPKGKSRKPK